MILQKPFAKTMPRFHIGLFVLLAASQLFAWPHEAEASFDPFGTERSVKSDEFPATQDAARCDKEKIKGPLTLVDVVDLALCNNPQTRSLWISARIQAATVGVNMAAYLPTLSAQGNLSRNQSATGAQPTTTS